MNEIPFPEDCPDVTYGMADAAFEACHDTFEKMGYRMLWESCTPFYYAIQAAIDWQRNQSPETI